MSGVKGQRMTARKARRRETSENENSSTVGGMNTEAEFLLKVFIDKETEKC